MFIDQKMCLLPLRKQSCVKAKRIIVSTKAKKPKQTQRHFHIHWLYLNEVYFEYGYVLSSKTPLMLHALDIALPHDVHLKTNLMWLSVYQITEHLYWWELCWTALRALCPGPSLWRFNALILGVSESVSVLVHVPMSLCTSPSVVEGCICCDSEIATVVLSNGDTKATLKLVLAVVKEGA